MAQNYKSMLEIWEARTFACGPWANLCGVFQPWGQLSIPDNWLIRESCILVIRPEFEIRSVRAQVVNTES